MSEFEDNYNAYLDLSMNGEPFQMTRHNATLFSFLGRQMIEGAEEDISKYDHIFLQTGQEDEAAVGGYVFGDSEVFATLANFMNHYQFPMILNRLNVPQCDIDAWNKSHFQDIGDFVPEEWGDGTA